MGNERCILVKSKRDRSTRFGQLQGWRILVSPRWYPSIRWLRKWGCSVLSRFSRVLEESVFASYFNESLRRRLLSRKMLLECLLGIWDRQSSQFENKRKDDNLTGANSHLRLQHQNHRWRDIGPSEKCWSYPSDLEFKANYFRRSRGKINLASHHLEIPVPNLFNDSQPSIDTTISVIMLAQTLRASVCIILSFWVSLADYRSAPRSPVSRDSKQPAWSASAHSSLPQPFVKVRIVHILLPGLQLLRIYTFSQLRWRSGNSFVCKLSLS